MQDDDVMHQWALRRKRVQEETQALERAEREAAAAEDEAEIADALAEESLTEEELLAKWDLPNPDTVVSGDDLSGFFKEGVPEFLKRRALRALWVSNPILANLDGLNDYDTDFTIVEPILSSSYTAGVGYAKQVIEKAFADMPDAETRSVRPPEMARVLNAQPNETPEPLSESEAETVHSEVASETQANDALQNASAAQALHTANEKERGLSSGEGVGDVPPSAVRYPARMRFDS